MANKGKEKEDGRDEASKLLSELGLTDQILSRALDAARQVLVDAQLIEKFDIRCLDISQISPEVIDRAKRNGCGTHRVCYREPYCEEFSGGWKACGSRWVCEDYPKC